MNILSSYSASGGQVSMDGKLEYLNVQVEVRRPALILKLLDGLKF